MKTCAQAESESNLPNQPPPAICSDTDLVFHSIYYDENAGKFMILPEDTSNATNYNESLGSSCDIPADIALLVSPSPSSDPAEIIISPSTVPTPPPRPASAPINNVTTAKCPCEEDHFFNKRGSEVDAPDAFCLFVAARLRNMKEEIRKECENEILKVLTKY
ncbi:hypothetical protein RF55_23643 [Lasius niger]|uniref:Uncharacterized protein n=1 Tax=Lasius niger TaxID=67767 RepID=A0A0J7JWI0_LASNI|nr:hypothetical protein RF55_23643 [Lasius niger]